MATQKRNQTILVLTSLEHRCAWQKQIPLEPITRIREDDDVSIDGGDNELDRLGLKYVPQGPAPSRVVRGRDEVVPVRSGVFEDELIVVAPDNEDGFGTCAQAPRDVVAWRVTCAGDEHSRGHAGNPRVPTKPRHCS